MNNANIQFPSTSCLIQYELNEVPWRVMDWYIERRPESHLAKVLDHAISLTSVTYDEGELHPWSTWPTLHRGIYNTQHHIHFINQDKSCAEDFPPIWETLVKEGKRVGIFGSLQTYPIPQDLAFSFYIPDTFAPAPDTYPSNYEAFQRLNLRQTKKDGATASEVSIDESVIKDLLLLKLNGMRFSTCIELARHLLHERRDALYRSRRPVLQALLSFDVFSHALRKYTPDYSTFFTNHVAGVMHRYWKYAFPEDFNYRMKKREDFFHQESLLWAMDIADAQIGYLKQFADQHNGSLIVASSMGQEAIEREYHGELRLEDKQQLCHAIDYKAGFTDLLAMHPNFNFKFDSIADRDDFIQRVSNLHDFNGKPIFYGIEKQGLTIALSLGCPADLIERQVVLYKNAQGESIEIPLHEAGLRALWRDVGTGYHQPKGSFIWYHKDLSASGARAEIESAAIAPLILAAMGVQSAAPIAKTSELPAARAS